MSVISPSKKRFHQDDLFIRESLIPVSVEALFRWHESPGALERLIPPWQNVRIVSREGGLSNNGIVHLKIGPWPFSINWIAAHHSYIRNNQFTDDQLKGPFSFWQHRHQFEARGDKESVLGDHIRYRLPKILDFFLRKKVFSELERMFDFRHRRTKQDLMRHQHYQSRQLKTMKILITGATGLIGSELVPFLQGGGHTVIRAVRKQPKGTDIVWYPENASGEAPQLEGFDAVIHLAGENIAGHWSADKKRRILMSRVEGTRHLVAALGKLKQPPKIFISASAIGFYGDRKDQEQTETSPKGSSFLSDVVQEWEEEAQKAAQYGMRVVQARIGVVLSPKGGALGSMLTPFRLGLGGIIGDGTQYMSWIAMDDLLGAFLHVLSHEAITGLVNFVGPHPATNRELTKDLGAVLKRPTVLCVPAFAARLLFGEVADELLLCSLRVKPEKLMATGFHFLYPHLKEAFEHLLGR